MFFQPEDGDCHQISLVILSRSEWVNFYFHWNQQTKYGFPMISGEIEVN